MKMLWMLYWTRHSTSCLNEKTLDVVTNLRESSTLSYKATFQGQQSQQTRGCSRQIANLLGLNGTVRMVHNILNMQLRKFDRYCFIVFDEI